MGKLGSECYKTTLCKRLAQPLSNALCRYAPILIVSYYSMFLWAASLIYLDIDQAKMIVLRLLENIVGVSVRVRASQKQPVVEWGCEALLFLLDFSFFSSSTFWVETLYLILIYCKRWDDWYLRFLFPTLLASKGDHTSRWSLFSVSFNKFSLQLSWVGTCAKSPGWTMERCGKETQSCQAMPYRHCL